VELGYISKSIVETSGKRWPLSVDAGVVGCDEPGGKRWFEDGNGKRYGANGMARPPAYADIKEIWLVDVEKNERLAREDGVPPPTPYRVVISPITSAAGRFCNRR